MRNPQPAALAHIVAPADAQHVEDWIDETGTGVWARFIRGTRRYTGGVHVDVCGWQAADGTVDRHVAVFAPDADLDAATARAGRGAARRRRPARPARGDRARRRGDMSDARPTVGGHERRLRQVLLVR